MAEIAFSFKQSDIKPCAACGRGLMACGYPLFYRLRIERCGFDAQAIRRQHGLEMMMGKAAALAAVMGPNENMAIRLDGPREALICEECSHKSGVIFPALVGDQ